jgi:hypothetical protein
LRASDDCCSSKKALRASYDYYLSEEALRASNECYSSESDFGKTLLVEVRKRGISRKVVKGGNDGMLNLQISWNNRCSQ